MGMDSVQQIKRQLYLGMNGDVSSAMQERGIVYRLNYGLNLPQIRQIASLYSPSKELASALWKEKIRETMILSLILAPVDEYSQQELIQWGKDFPTFELSTLGSFYLFSKREDACNIVSCWLEDQPREELVALSLYTLARAVKSCPEKGDQVLQILSSLTGYWPTWAHPSMEQGFFLVLRETGKVRSDMHSSLLSLAQKWSDLFPWQQWRILLEEEWYEDSLSNQRV